MNPRGLAFSPGSTISQPTVSLRVLDAALSCSAQEPLRVTGRLLNGPAPRRVDIFAWFRQPDGTIVGLLGFPRRDFDMPADLRYETTRNLGKGCLTPNLAAPGAYAIGVRVVDSRTGEALSQAVQAFTVSPP